MWGAHGRRQTNSSLVRSTHRVARAFRPRVPAGTHRGPHGAPTRTQGAPQSRMGDSVATARRDWLTIAAVRPRVWHGPGRPPTRRRCPHLSGQAVLPNGLSTGSIKTFQGAQRANPLRKHTHGTPRTLASRRQPLTSEMLPRSMTAEPSASSGRGPGTPGISEYVPPWRARNRSRNVDAAPPASMARNLTPTIARAIRPVQTRPKTNTEASSGSKGRQRQVPVVGPARHSR